MTTLFYIFGLFIFIFQLGLLVKWNERFNKLRYQSKYEEITGTKYKDANGNNIFLFYFGMVIILSAIYYLIGLMSSNWILFLSIFSVTLSMSLLFKIVKRFSKKFIYSKTHKFLSFLMIVYSSLMTLFISLNHFHFKIDFINLIKNIL